MAGLSPEKFAETEDSLLHRNLLCPICHYVLKDPQSLTCPGTSGSNAFPHTFCGQCLDDIRGRNNSCPTCRHPRALQTARPNLALREIITNLQIQCKLNFDALSGEPRRSDKCGWTGKPSEWQSHIQGNECPLQYVTCPANGCLHFCRRKDMERHWEEQTSSHVLGVMKLKLDELKKEFELKLESKLGEQSRAFESKLDQQTSAFDAKLAALKKQFDAKFATPKFQLKQLGKQSRAFESKLDQQTSAFDAKLAVLKLQFDAKLAAPKFQLEQLDEQSRAFESQLDQQTSAFDAKLAALKFQLEHPNPDFLIIPAVSIAVFGFLVLIVKVVA